MERKETARVDGRALLEIRFTETKKLIETIFRSGASQPISEVVDKTTLPDDEERLKLYNDFFGKPWWKIAFDTIFKHRQAIPLLNPSGFRACLPAFLVASLQVGHPESEDLCSWCIMSLNPMTEENKPIKFVFEQFDLFTPEERKVVAKYVALFLDFPGLLGDQSRSAISAYWGAYAS